MCCGDIAWIYGAAMISVKSQNGYPLLRVSRRKVLSVITAAIFTVLIYKKGDATLFSLYLLYHIDFIFVFPKNIKKG